MKFHLPQKAFEQFEKEREECLKITNQLRREAKLAIGYLLQNEQKNVLTHLKQGEVFYEKLQKTLKGNPLLHKVGGIESGMEEYVEALLLNDYISKGALRPLTALYADHEVYLAGLCDMTGELVRLARKEPGRMKKILQDLIGIHQECLKLISPRNSNLRNKLEDVERNLRRLEEMVFVVDHR